MDIEKIDQNNIIYVDKCDELFKNFLESERIYDTNSLEYIPNSFKKDISKDNVLLYIAKLEGKVVAFLYGYIETNIRQKLPVAHLTFIYVEENYRKQKIATRLIDCFLHEVKQKNVEIIEVKAFENNKIACDIYEKLGFKPLWINYRKMI